VCVCVCVCVCCVLFVVCLYVFRFSFCTGDVYVDFSTACVKFIDAIVSDTGTNAEKFVSYLAQMPIVKFYAE